MRVIDLRRTRRATVRALVLGVALATLALGSAPGHARAQVVVGGSPAAPTSWAEAVLAARYLRAESIGGATSSVGLRGAWAPVPVLEVGGSLGVAGTWLRADGAARGTNRVGLVPIGAWLGLGARVGEISTGARMMVEVAPRAFGADGIDSGGSLVAAGARVDSAMVLAVAQIRLAASFGMIAGDSDAGSLVGAVLTEVMIGDYRSRVRPFARFAVRFAADMPVSGELGLGCVIRLVPHWLLRAAVTASDRTDPSAERVRGELALVWVPPLRRSGW